MECPINCRDRFLMRFLLLLLLLALLNGGCAVPAAPTDKFSDDMAAGRKVYLSKCAKCHKLYDPTKYSDKEWQAWMRKMSRKAKLSPDQQRMLSNYIEARLRGPIKSR